MKKALFFIGLCVFPFLCFGTIVISLGETCNVATALKDHNLRKQSLPFDWNITPFYSLLSILDDDFQDFLNPNYLVLRDDERTVINTKYGIEFAHDFPTNIPDPPHDNLHTEHSLNSLCSFHPIRSNFLDYLPEVQEKYKRRIDRLYGILQGTDDVIFIRHNHSHVFREEIVRLYDLVCSKFPLLNFTLVLMGIQLRYGRAMGK